jgi:hypothetical protein
MSTYYTVSYESSLDVEEYWVKISYQPSSTINQTVSSSSQQYVTPHYPSAEQARMHAKGWMDCMSYYQSCKQIPDDNRDSYENRYREHLDEFRNNLSIFNKELELAYREGWETKLEKLNNIN